MASLRNQQITTAGHFLIITSPLSSGDQVRWTCIVVGSFIEWVSCQLEGVRLRVQMSRDVRELADRVKPTPNFRSIRHFPRALTTLVVLSIGALSGLHLSARSVYVRLE